MHRIFCDTQNDHYPSFARNFLKFHKAYKDLKNGIPIIPCAFEKILNA